MNLKEHKNKKRHHIDAFIYLIATMLFKLSYCLQNPSLPKPKNLSGTQV